LYRVLNIEGDMLLKGTVGYCSLVHWLKYQWTVHLMSLVMDLMLNQL